MIACGILEPYAEFSCVTHDDAYEESDLKFAAPEQVIHHLVVMPRRCGVRFGMRVPLSDIIGRALCVRKDGVNKGLGVPPVTLEPEEPRLASRGGWHHMGHHQGAILAKIAAERTSRFQGTNSLTIPAEIGYDYRRKLDPAEAF